MSNAKICWLHVSKFREVLWVSLQVEAAVDQEVQQAAPGIICGVKLRSKSTARISGIVLEKLWTPNRSET